MSAKASQPEAVDGPVRTSPGLLLLIGENYYTVMGAVPQPWLLRQQDFVVASSRRRDPARVSAGDRLLMEEHFYLLMGTDEEPRLVHQGVVPAPKRVEHRFHGPQCEARGF